MTHRPSQAQPTCLRPTGGLRPPSVAQRLLAALAVSESEGGAGSERIEGRLGLDDCSGSSIQASLAD